jgi:DnaK suppressor protein
MGTVDPIRRRLESERARVLDSLARLSGDYDAVVTASRDSNADDEHDPEGATIAFERSQVGALVRQVQRHLAEIELAVERWDAGTYGTCERCGTAIGDARLQARPVARTCVPCAAVDKRL